MKRFTTIVADPPWKFKDELGMGATSYDRGAVKEYDVLNVRGIVEAYPVPDLAAADARLFLWRVASMQPEAFAVLKAWGFTVKAEMVWHKLTVTGKTWFGMGRQVRNSHEVCLIATRGRPKRLSASVRSIFAAPYTGHSRKPDLFFEHVEELSPGPRLELFSRERRKGWTCKGKELGTPQK